jgi:hypothetical protein
MFQKARIAVIMWSLCSVMGFASQVQLIGLNQYQQLNISTKYYPMQSNVIASQYNGEVYPQVIVGFDSDVRLSIGSVFNYSTDDYFFFNEHRQNISMAQLEYETLKFKGLMGAESGYVSLGFANTISLIANKDEATTMGAFGLQFEAMDAIDVKAHYIIGNTANAEGKGHKASVAMPIQLFDVTNTVQITSISMDWDVASPMPLWTGFFNHHRKIKELLYTNANAIIIDNHIKYETALFKLFLRVSYLDSPSHYLTTYRGNCVRVSAFHRTSARFIRV